MSVLQCDRNGCENIMCDRLSDRYGYICDECFEELVQLGVAKNVHEFMYSRKEEKEYVNDKELAYQRYDGLFKRNREEE